MSIQNRTVFLVGVDHRIQYTNASCGPDWKAKLQEFEDYLVSQTRTLSADLLAEEFNEELLTRNCASACTVRDAADRAGRKHLFCDPTNAEREGVGTDLHEEKERIWLERLNSTDATRIIFVCGNDHLSTFSSRLLATGYAASEISREWGKDWCFFR